jgi:methylated-DNA-[protein]-cysteine S-methyltransferase
MKINTSCGAVKVELKGNKIRKLKLCSRRVATSPPKTSQEQRLQQDLIRYFAGDKVSFLAYPIDLSDLSEFTRRVLEGARQIPHGACLSYGELAASIGRPKAARAVGQALGRNPIPIIIPCHRVVGKTGALVGFSAGLEWKKALLNLETKKAKKK